MPVPARIALTLLPFVAMTGLQGASVAIVNPGFEDISGESPFNEFTFGPLNGWDLYDPGAITDNGDGPTYFIGTLQPTIVASTGNTTTPQFFPGGAPEGSRVGIAFNFSGSGGGGEYGLQQTLSHILQANTTYTLTALVGNIASGRDVGQNDYNLNGFPGYRIDLLAGAALLATTQTIDPGAIAEGAFATAEYQYTTGASDPELGQALTIRLVNLNQVDGAFPAADLEVDFDDIRLDATAIPEARTATLLALMLLGLALRRPARVA